MSLGGGSSTENVPLLTKQQRGLLNQLTGFVAGGIGEGGPVFQGQRQADLSPLQQQAINFFGGQGFNQGLQNLGQANQFFGGQVNQQFNPAQVAQEFQVDTANPALRNFQQNIVPGISERFAGRNALRSGAFGRNLAEAGGNLQANLAAQLGRRQVGERTRLNQNQFAGAQGLQQNALLPQQLLGPLLGLGGLQQGQQQGQLNAQQARFQEGLATSNPLLQLLGPALNTQAFQPVVSQQQGLGSILGPGLGAFLGTEVGAGAFGSALGGIGSAGAGGLSALGAMI